MSSRNLTAVEHLCDLDDCVKRTIITDTRMYPLGWVTLEPPASVGWTGDAYTFCSEAHAQRWIRTNVRIQNPQVYHVAGEELDRRDVRGRICDPCWTGDHSGHDWGAKDESCTRATKTSAPDRTNYCQCRYHP